MKEGGRSKFGRGSRSLHWGMSDLIGFRVKASGHGKITRGMREVKTKTGPWDIQTLRDGTGAQLVRDPEGDVREEHRGECQWSRGRQQQCWRCVTMLKRGL